MPGQYFYIEGMKYLLQNALNSAALSKITGQATDGSANIGNVSNFANLFVGQQIAGDNIPDGTFILDLDGSSGTITVSQPANGNSGGGSQTFVVGGNYQANLPLTVHLLSGPIPQISAPNFSQFTEANYDGYAPQECVGPVIVSSPPPRQYAVAQFQRLVFEPSDYNTGNNITGHLVTFTPPGSSTPLPCWSETYAESLDIQEDGDMVTVNPVASLAFDETAGVSSPGIG